MPVMLFCQISALLKGAREQSGLTQGEIARAVGWSSPQFWSNIERGMCGLPPDYWEPISRLLNVDIRQIEQADLLDYFSKRDAKKAKPKKLLRLPHKRRLDVAKKRGA